MLSLESLVLPWWLIILLIAFAVLGVIQVLKNGALKKWPTWSFALIAVLLYFGFAALVVFLPAKIVLFLAFGVLSLALGQLLGYEFIGQTILGWFRKTLGLPEAPTKSGDGQAGIPGS